MKYPLISQCKMDWETEEHKFTFNTCGDQLCALDSLSDLIGSLQYLYAHILEEYNTYEKADNIPNSFKVVGDCCYTHVKKGF